MAAVKKSYFFLLFSIKCSVLSALEFCEHKYWCKSGHCCGGGTCCTYYYELWWFWLVWIVVAVLSCCCFYQHKRFRRRQRSSQSRSRRRRQRGLFRLPLPLFDPSKQLRLPTYEEVSQSPTDPPPYTPLNETTLQQTDLTPLSCSGAAIFQWPSNNAQENVCQAEINSSDSAGLLDNEELPEYTEMPSTATMMQQYQSVEHYCSNTTGDTSVIADSLPIRSPTSTNHLPTSPEVIPFQPPPPYTPHGVTHDSLLSNHEPPLVQNGALLEDTTEGLEVANSEYPRPSSAVSSDSVNRNLPVTNDSDIQQAQQDQVCQTVISDRINTSALQNHDSQLSDLSVDT